jgi:carbon-monoxide dehydrogenase medium subunit
MKPVAFKYQRPSTLSEALRALSDAPDAKVLAGGQTLGPMLNLRLVQPAALIDITRISELALIKQDHDAIITIGATVTHAAIEDANVRGHVGSFLAEVAHGIGYRAVRTRGTIGGSLAHADPAADWLACLTALDADVLITGASDRQVPIRHFVRAAMDTELAPQELIAAVRIPNVRASARFGFHKICRKAGEFAEAIGVVVHEADSSKLRLVVSTPAAAPIIIDGTGLHLDRAGTCIADTSTLEQRLRAAGFREDRYEFQLRAAVLGRAYAKAFGQ